MKKLDNPEYKSNKVLTQDKCEFLIESMYDDLGILIEEYLQDLPEDMVYQEILRCLIFNIYHTVSNHQHALKLVKNGIDSGVMLWKDVKDEEQWMKRNAAQT